MHEGQKSYKCDSCGISFSVPGYLKKHVNIIHEGKRNYACDFCEKTLSRSGTLKKHIKRINLGNNKVNHFL